MVSIDSKARSRLIVKTVETIAIPANIIRTPFINGAAISYWLCKNRGIFQNIQNPRRFHQVSPKYPLVI
jgi:hypothetical protein